MAETKKLARFTAIPQGDEFQLHIEDDSGETLELSATREQIDVIADNLDDLLSEDDSLDEVDDAEDEDQEDEDSATQTGKDAR